jgi:hypothetical protein
MSTTSAATGYDGAMAATLLQDPFSAELTVLDRCDRCGAQAYVRATLHVGGELLFCAHHGREHLPVLRGQATVQDESNKLYEDAALMKQATTEV